MRKRGLVLLAFLLVLTNNLWAEQDTRPPVIEILAPVNNSTTASNIVYGRVSPDTVKVSVNGTAASIFDKDKFIARTNLNSSDNAIIVKAEDAAGNVGTSSVNVTYDPKSDKVKIISPKDNATINLSPMVVKGSVDEGIESIVVNYTIADMQNNAFVAEAVRLNPIERTVPTKVVLTVEARDKDYKVYADSIIINTPQLQEYKLEKISRDVREIDEQRPVAGETCDLKVKLLINNKPAIGKAVKFSVVKGKGSLLQAIYLTDMLGEIIVPFTTDKDAAVTNMVKAEAMDNPLANVAFNIDTKPAPAARLIPLNVSGGKRLNIVPGAELGLQVKLVDSNNNPVPDKEIKFVVMKGNGTIANTLVKTAYSGVADTTYKAGNKASNLDVVKAYSVDMPSIKVNFSLNVVPTKMTVDKIMAVVKNNDEKIKDITADIDVTSNASWSAPQMKLKIWQKGDKQKVEQIYPTQESHVRPALEQSSTQVEFNKEIISYDSQNDIYVIKIKEKGQQEEYPYELHSVDYKKGVVIKTESYQKEEGFFIMKFVSEPTNFVQKKGAWVYTKLVESTYVDDKLEEQTTNLYSNIEVNRGISDLVFTE